MRIQMATKMLQKEIRRKYREGFYETIKLWQKTSHKTLHKPDRAKVQDQENAHCLWIIKRWFWIHLCQSQGTKINKQKFKLAITRKHQIMWEQAHWGLGSRAYSRIMQTPRIQIPKVRVQTPIKGRKTAITAKVIAKTWPKRTVEDPWAPHHVRTSLTRNHRFQTPSMPAKRNKPKEIKV